MVNPIAYFIGKALRPYVADKLWNNTPKLDEFARRHFQLSNKIGILLALILGGLILTLIVVKNVFWP